MVVNIRIIEFLRIIEIWWVLTAICGSDIIFIEGNNMRYKEISKDQIDVVVEPVKNYYNKYVSKYHSLFTPTKETTDVIYRFKARGEVYHLIRKVPYVKHILNTNEVESYGVEYIIADINRRSIGGLYVCNEYAANGKSTTNCNIDYEMFDDMFKGKGVMSSALKVVIDDIFVNNALSGVNQIDESLPKIRCETIDLIIFPENFASQCVAKSNSFTQVDLRYWQLERKNYSNEENCRKMSVNKFEYIYGKSAETDFNQIDVSSQKTM